MTLHSILIDIVLFTALIISLFTDLKSRKILNIVTYPTAILGIVINTIFLQMDGLRFSVVGWLVGFSVFWILNVVATIGMGDVKLIAAIGALKGYFFTLNAMIYIALVGGVIAIIYAIVTGQLMIIIINMFNKLFGKKSEIKYESKYLPYGPSIVAGVLIYYISLIYDFSLYNFNF